MAGSSELPATFFLERDSPMKYVTMPGKAGLAIIFLAAFLAAGGCASRDGERSEVPSATDPGQGTVETETDQGPGGPETILPEQYVRISTYLTDSETSEGLSGAEVLLGGGVLLPTPLPAEYGVGQEGLYDTDAVEEGAYLFKARRRGYRTLVGRVEVPPLPDAWSGHAPPVVLELEDPREAEDGDRSMRSLILWQKYKRTPDEAPPHPTMPSKGPKGFHSLTIPKPEP
jgi:hypothetical protein